jgi:fatty-acyl-CoA synthase
MLGLMQNWPLLCHRIIEHAAAIHGNQEVVTRSVEGPVSAPPTSRFMNGR